MTTTITVIGLGQVGTSIGLSLAEYKDRFTRIGHDSDPALMRSAEKIAAFDKIAAKLPDAVRDADVVILAMPTDLIRDGFKLMSKAIKPEAVVICMANVVRNLYTWARELLPAGQPFVVLTPVVNPNRLEDGNADLQTPHSDFFNNSDMLISGDYDTPHKAIQTASELCELLKARPFFIDPVEADGLIARVEHLPKLTAAAMVYILTKTPGWRDSRRLAARSFNRVASTCGLYDEQEYFGITGILNKENVNRALDQMISALQEMRSMIDSEDEDGLKQVLQDARQEYDTWQEQRRSGDWDKNTLQNVPERRDMISRLFGGKPVKKNNS